MRTIDDDNDLEELDEESLEAPEDALGPVFARLVEKAKLKGSMTVDELKEKGLWIFAAEAGGEKFYEQDLTCGAAVVLGSEGKGVAKLLLDKCDFILSIPMYGKVNSFNVAAAGAVILCEAARQRNK